MINNPFKDKAVLPLANGQRPRLLLLLRVHNCHTRTDAFVRWGMAVTSVAYVHFRPQDQEAFYTSVT
jgi:hypothetical protein